jgi:hypothetical protein
VAYGRLGRAQVATDFGYSQVEVCLERDQVGVRARLHVRHLDLDARHILASRFGIGECQTKSPVHGINLNGQVMPNELF